MNRVMVVMAWASWMSAATVTAAEMRFVDEAKVVTVETVMKTVEVRKPSKTCWQERVEVSRAEDDSATSEILGGVLGGVVGNQFGDGAGKSLMTGAGVLLGASLGNDYDRASTKAVRYEEVERCETTSSSVSSKEVIDHYRVVLDYNGNEMEAIMLEPPKGDTVELYVTASTENRLPVSNVKRVKTSSYRESRHRSHRRGHRPGW